MVYLISFCETIDSIIFVFLDAAKNIVCDANIKQSTGMVCHYIDIPRFIHHERIREDELKFY